MSSAWSSAPSTASTVLGPISWPPSTSSTSSSTTARASATRPSSPSSVSWLPRRRIVHWSRSRSAPRTPSPTPASSAATSFEIERTSCNGHSVGTALAVGAFSAVPPWVTFDRSAGTVTLAAQVRYPRGTPCRLCSPRGGGWEHLAGPKRTRPPRTRPNPAHSGQLLANHLADDRAVGAAGDLRRHVRHDAADVADARRADLGDRVVDDPFQLVLGERLGHELGEHRQLRLLGLGLRLPAASAERLDRLKPPLALTLEHLQLLVV